EWEEVYNGIYYGTLKHEVDRIIESGRHVIFDVDVVGGINIKKHYGKRALSVFVKPPSIEELKNRLEKRSTETAEKINMRLEKAGMELAYESQFDVVLINDRIEETTLMAEKIVAEFLNEQHQS